MKLARRINKDQKSIDKRTKYISIKQRTYRKKLVIIKKQLTLLKRRVKS